MAAQVTTETNESLQQRVRELSDELKSIKNERDDLKKALAKLETVGEIYDKKQNDTLYRI